MNPELRKLINELPPEHTCKDARSREQIYEDNIQHEHKQFMANVDSTLDYYHNQYSSRTWGSNFVDRLTDYPDMTIREFFEMAACDDEDDFDPDIDYGEMREKDLSLEENAEWDNPEVMEDDV